MSLIHEIRIRPKPAESFAGVLGSEIVEETRRHADEVRAKLAGRTIWNVNSTAAGGGVAEMLHTLLSYASGFGIQTRWLVAGGGPDFFRITKRIHNALHGERGDGSKLDGSARNIYESISDKNASELNRIVQPNDLVILHDPQTAGLIPHLGNVTARRGNRDVAERMHPLRAGPHESVVRGRLPADAVVVDLLEGHALGDDPLVVSHRALAVEPQLRLVRALTARGHQVLEHLLG